MFCKTTKKNFHSILNQRESNNSLSDNCELPKEFFSPLRLKIDGVISKNAGQGAKFKFQYKIKTVGCLYNYPVEEFYEKKGVYLTI